MTWGSCPISLKCPCRSPPYHSLLAWNLSSFRLVIWSEKPANFAQSLLTSSLCAIIGGYIWINLSDHNLHTPSRPHIHDETLYQPLPRIDTAQSSGFHLEDMGITEKSPPAWMGISLRTLSLGVVRCDMDKHSELSHWLWLQLTIQFSSFILVRLDNPLCLPKA